MNKKTFVKKMFIFLMVFSIMTAGIPVQAAAVSDTTVKTQELAAVKKGWVKESVGYCYYVNGKKVTNQWKTISKKKYYFGSNGARKTGWYTIKNKSYYFSSKGVLQKSKSIDASLVKSMDAVIKGQKITDKTAKKTALKKLFTHVQTKCDYGRVVGFKGQKGWEYTFAKEMLSKKKGSCYHYAAAFAFLAKRATGYPVRICWGTSNAFNTSRWQAHAWVEIKIGSTWYTYDPNAARYSTIRKGKWYQQNRSIMTGKIYKTQKTVNVEL